MSSPTRRDVVLALLQDVGLALDDDDIADRLGMNRHYVNAVCNKLADAGLIKRAAGPAGKLVNSALAGAGAAAQPGRSELSRRESPKGAGPTRGRVGRADRSRRNVDELISDFDRCLAQFEQSNAFPGPSLYFHERALDRRRVHADAASLVDDELFMEYVYAVLPAWGMHRMGKQAAKIGDFDVMRASFRRALPGIEALWGRRIVAIDADEANDIAAAVWDVISILEVSTSQTRIVAGSKALHHVLPNLVPPIDRQYTFRFFTGQMSVNYGDRRAFLEWFPYFCAIGRRRRAEIEQAVARGGVMATGPAKVIDNAIMGFVQLRNIDELGSVDQ